jgi:hypothetical protein
MGNRVFLKMTQCPLDIVQQKLVVQAVKVFSFEPAPCFA